MKHHFYNPGDLLFYETRYTNPRCDDVLYKKRPVIVLRNMDDDMCVVMQLSTMKNKKYLTKYDILLKHEKYKEYLDKECYVQPHKTFIVNQYYLRTGKKSVNLFKKNPDLFKDVVDKYIEFQKETIGEFIVEESKNRYSYMLKNANSINDSHNVNTQLHVFDKIGDKEK